MLAGGHRLVTNKETIGGVRFVNYTVRAGDTLNSIAARFGVPVQELIRVNNIAYPYYIYVGQNLYIPVSTTPAPTSDVERRLTRVENRVDALRDDYTKLDDRVDRLETRMNRLEARVTRLERIVPAPPPTPTVRPTPRPTATPRPR
nr:MULTISPECIES: LysM peptidoglycan-binding domain-containing protein [Brevibacillus]